MNADDLLARLEQKFGREPDIAERLRPIVQQLFAAGTQTPERRSLLRLVVETYARHSRLQRNIESMRDRLQRRVNEVYGRLLGIQPP